MKTLAKAQLDENLAFIDECISVGARTPPTFILAADAVQEAGVVVVVLSDRTVTSMDFTEFASNPTAAPDFLDLEIIDHGLTLRLGSYEVDVDTFLTSSEFTDN